jgi:tetrathionate reductase subunit B
MVRYGMLVDLKSCFGCRACFVACKNVNEIPVGEYNGREYYRARPKDRELGNYPYVVRNTTPLLCMQCQDPPCISVCPVPGAISKRKDGIVVIDQTKCTGDQLCIAACPYDAIYYRADKKVADKCDLCASRIDAGKQPICATTCIANALIFGDLDDPNSLVSSQVKELDARPLHAEYGTSPSVYYTSHSAMLHASVKDSAGAIVQGATATLTNLETGAAVTASSDGEGRVVFRNLKIRGAYSLMVEMDGYNPKNMGVVYIADDYTDLKAVKLFQR